MPTVAVKMITFTCCCGAVRVMRECVYRRRQQESVSGNVFCGKRCPIRFGGGPKLRPPILGDEDAGKMNDWSYIEKMREAKAQRERVKREVERCHSEELIAERAPEKPNPAVTTAAATATLRKGTSARAAKKKFG